MYLKGYIFINKNINKFNQLRFLGDHHQKLLMPLLKDYMKMPFSLRDTNLLIRHNNKLTK